MNLPCWPREVGVAATWIRDEASYPKIGVADTLVLEAAAGNGRFVCCLQQLAYTDESSNIHRVLSWEIRCPVEIG